MKRFLVGFLISIAAHLSLPFHAHAQMPPQGYKLVWADEFHCSGLPDPTKWSYEEGFIRNSESQYYTKARKANARVEHGMLVIEARKEEYKIEGDGDHAGETAHYTSASLITQQKMSMTYGRVEVRAKLPQGKGVWPAIWTLGVNEPKVGWPACGEIDIMEFVGCIPDHVYATVHWGKDEKHHVQAEHPLEVKAPFDDFHNYAMEWTPEQIKFYFDQTCYGTFDVKRAGQKDGNPFCRPHYLILNLALGGEWGGAIDDTKLPQKYLVQYVRVYQKTPPGK